MQRDHYSTFSPDADAIDAFCETTGDTNKLHRKQSMHVAGLRPLVPGMMTLLYACAPCHDFLAQDARRIDAHFGGMVHAGDTLQIGLPQYNDRGIQLRAFRDGADMLSAGNNHTMVSPVRFPDRKVRGIQREFDVHIAHANRLARIVPSGCRVNDLLYMMSIASHMLLKSVEHPESEIEQALHDLTHDPKHPILPVYQSMHFGFSKPNPELRYDGTPLEVVTDMEHVAKRQYHLHMRCTQQGRTLYDATFKIQAMPEKVLMRQAKPVKK